jgi:hypothetical protein
MVAKYQFLPCVLVPPFRPCSRALPWPLEVLSVFFDWLDDVVFLLRCSGCWLIVEILIKK